MKPNKRNPFITHTPQEEIEICEKCPYPKPKCGANGCDYFISKKKRLAEEKNKQAGS